MLFAERINMVLRFSGSARDLRGKIACGLMGLASPLSDVSRPPLLGKGVPDMLRLSPSRLRGMNLLIKPHDWSETIIYNEIFVEKGYDLSVMSFQPEHVVDCGGHIGLFSLLASATFPSAKITIFEPNPDNFARIRENSKLNDLDWDCRLGALGATAGEAYLQVFNSHSARISADRGVRTTVFDLAAFISALGSRGLLLKVDIEGEEKTMWHKLIPSLPPQTIVFFETHHGSEGWSYAEHLFRENGFQVRKLVDRGLFCDGYATRAATPCA